MVDRSVEEDRALRALIRLHQQLGLYIASDPEGEDAIEMLSHVRDQMDDHLIATGVRMSGLMDEQGEEPDEGELLEFGS